MSENSPDSVLGSLPHSRPHRRSEKRAARAESAEPTEPVEARAEPTEPEQSPSSCPSLPTGTELAGTVVKAAVELTEIGLTLSARALRIAISRLPRP